MKPEEWFARMQGRPMEIRKAELPQPGMLEDQLRAVDGYDPSAHARMVGCPVLSVHGLADIMTEPS